MLPVKKALPDDQKQLLAIYTSLAPEQQEQLQAFAEFLAYRRGQETGEAVTEGEIVDIPRPVEETVIAAMRRLRATYPRLNTDGLLDQASVLMSAHILQGQTAVQVIDELEILFEQAHENGRD